MDSVIIIGTGPSLAKTTLAQITGLDARILCVNSSIGTAIGMYADAWFTLDPSPVNILLMAERMPGVNYYAAVPDDVALPHWVHRKQRIATKWAEDHPAPYWIKRWSCTLGLQEDPDKISTGNSAYGALNLAYHWRPKRIYLLGVDGVNAPRATGGMPNDLTHLPFLFASATPQLYRAGIEVINLSMESAITCFPIKSIKEVLNERYGSISREGKV